MKPSPVVSILLFVAAAALVFGLLGRGWYTHDDEYVRAHSGPVWGEVCLSKNMSRDFDSRTRDAEMECKTTTFLSDLGEGKWGVARVVWMLFVLVGLAGMVITPIAGFALLKKSRSALSVLTLSFVGGSLLLIIVLLVYEVADTKDLHLPEYGFFIYLLGAVLGSVAAIIGMARAPGVQPRLAQGYQAPAHPTCGMQMQWVAQYGRWFCSRCNQYM